MKKYFNKNYIIIAILVIAIILTLFTPEKTKITHDEMSYLDFLSELEKDNIDSAKSLPKGRIEFTLKSGNIYLTESPETDGFKEMLLLKGVRIIPSSKEPSINYVLPFIYIIMLGLIVMKSLKGPKNEINILRPGELDYDFEKIAGNQESAEDMREVIDFLKNPKKYEMMGAKMIKGVVLVGPPGTGKTLLSKVIAGEAKVPFIYANGADFVNMFVGRGASHVRAIYKKARKIGPCIVFIDEIDAVAKKRGLGNSGHSEIEQTVNALLGELDGFKNNNNVITIVATNRIDTIDEAFLRPGRFDRHITIGLPTHDDRVNIIKLYLQNKKIDDTVEIEAIAKDTFNCSGAFIENLINQATFEAIRRGSDSISSEDFNKAFDKIALKGSPRKTTDRNENDSLTTAWHEAGHVVVAKLLASMEVRKVTTISSTSGAEGFALIPPEKTKFYTKDKFEKRIQVAMGGRIAEHIKSGDFDFVSTGASGDIDFATNMLTAMFTKFAFDEKNKFVNLQTINYSNSEIHKKVIEHSEKLYEETYKFLVDNREKLEKLANELYKKETLNEKEIDAILQL